jgi:hypothetical protein
MPISIKGYYAPTPAKVRMVADGVDKLLKVVGASTIVTNHPIGGLVVLVAGELVKMLSNFFVES